jgi:hypothetical protein
MSRSAGAIAKEVLGALRLALPRTPPKHFILRSRPHL